MYRYPEVIALPPCHSRPEKEATQPTSGATTVVSYGASAAPPDGRMSGNTVPPPSKSEAGLRPIVNVKSVVSWCTSNEFIPPASYREMKASWHRSVSDDGIASG